MLEKHFDTKQGNQKNWNVKHCVKIVLKSVRGHVKNLFFHRKCMCVYSKGIRFEFCCLFFWHGFLLKALTNCQILVFLQCKDVMLGTWDGQKKNIKTAKKNSIVSAFCLLIGDWNDWSGRGLIKLKVHKKLMICQPKKISPWLDSNRTLAKSVRKAGFHFQPS